MTLPYMRRRSCWKPLLLGIAAVLGVAWLLSRIVEAHMPWYQALAKPELTPPDWAFGVIWPVLYVLMVIAARLAWSHSSRQKRTLVHRGRCLFLLQLALNFAWVPVFFGMENVQHGLAVLIATVLAALATFFCFWRIHMAAGLLLIPYVAWLGFATWLNYQILILN